MYLLSSFEITIYSGHSWQWWAKVN